jgi:hypothetical protein
MINAGGATPSPLDQRRNDIAFQRLNGDVDGGDLVNRCVAFGESQQERWHRRHRTNVRMNASAAMMPVSNANGTPMSDRPGYEDRTAVMDMNCKVDSQL